MHVHEMMREACLESAADEAFATLSSSPLFGGLDPAVLRRLAPRSRRVHVRAGETLVRQGDAGDALFVVVYGRLRAVLTDESGTERILGEIGRGETVGEMAVLTGEPRSSSVIAVRDSELIRLSRAEFERLSTAQPRMILELMRVLISRYRDTLRAPPAARLTTLAILPADASVPVRDFALNLVRVLRSQGSHALHVDTSRAEAAVQHRNGNGDRIAALAAWLHDLELDHDLVVYEAEPDEIGRAHV